MDRDLLIATINLEDLANLLDELIEREGIEPLADGSCGYSEADCGSRLCAECGCLTYKNRRLSKVIEAARAELRKPIGATP